ncbi:MAG: PcfJ domain-containing protein [Blautia sp.]|nr:PcfJ domain-containing protein [Blautia sp.]
MKKRDLLAMPELLATDEMIAAARRDRGRKRKIYSWASERKVFRELFVRVRIEDGILKVAFFCRKDMKEGERRPRYEVYVSAGEEKHLTYLPMENKWSGGQIGSQPIPHDGPRWNRCFDNCTMELWEEEGARMLVNQYFGWNDVNVFQAIKSYQQILQIKRLKGRHQKEKARIDQAMEQVPPLPKDFEDWVYKSAYSRSQYMLYRYGDKEHKGWCTLCGRNVKLPRQVKHQEMVRCPACRKKVIALSWNKQGQITDWKKPGILQERKDGNGYVLRIFESKIKRWKGGDYKLSTKDSLLCEKYRFFLSRNFEPEGIYEWAHFKNRYENELRWCSAINHGYYEGPTDECILYYRNLRRLRRGTELQYIPIEDLFRHNEGCYSYVIDQLYGLRKTPQMEYLIKLKLYRLAWDLTYRGKPGDNRGVNFQKRKPWEALWIDRQQLEMCIRMNISERQLLTLQAARMLEIRLTRQQVEWYASEAGAQVTGRLLWYGHPDKMMKYLQVLQKQQKTAVLDYVDYLDDIRVLKVEPTNDVIFPRNFQAAHERLSEQRQEREQELKIRRIAEKDRILQGMLPELREIYEGTKNEGYLMVLPTCKEDFNREGRENHNCVGGSYFDKMLKGESVVLFLRRKEEPDKAFCTVEMDGSRIIQCRAVRNSQPPKEVTDFMAGYSREVDKRIKKKAAATRIRIMAAV